MTGTDMMTLLKEVKKVTKEGRPRLIKRLNKLKKAKTWKEIALILGIEHQQQACNYAKGKEIGFENIAKFMYRLDYYEERL